MAIKTEHLFHKEFLRMSALLSAVCLFMVGIYSEKVEAQEVIVNMSVNKTKINKRVLKSIFRMQLLTWPDGTPIKVFVLPGKNSTHVSFSKTVLNTLPHSLQRNWDKLVFSGTGESPVIVKSEEEMLKRIATTRGAIGYVANIEKKTKIKVLHVY